MHRQQNYEEGVYEKEGRGLLLLVGEGAHGESSKQRIEICLECLELVSAASL